MRPLLEKVFSGIGSGYVVYDRINQSVENAGVAFVKGADERNKFFEKINNY